MAGPNLLTGSGWKVVHSQRHDGPRLKDKNALDGNMRPTRINERIFEEQRGLLRRAVDGEFSNADLRGDADGPLRGRDIGLNHANSIPYALEKHVISERFAPKMRRNYSGKACAPPAD